MFTNAVPVEEPLPLVLLSHGSGGNAVGLGWLAADLARRGMIVAAVNHPGTTSRDSIPEETVKVWERPQDLTALLDILLGSAPMGLNVDPDRIGVVGFSLGGHSALSLSGVRVSRAKLIEYCATYPDKIDCGWLNRAGVDLTAIDANRYGQSNKDPRVRATVAVDPALPLAAVSESLPDVAQPVLLINLGAPEDIPNGLRADGLAEALPDARYLSIPGSHHFSFLSECSWLGVIMISVAGDDNICADWGMRRRGIIMTRPARRLVDFWRSLYETPQPISINMLRVNILIRRD